MAKKKRLKRLPKLPAGERREHQFHLDLNMDAEFEARCRDLGVTHSLYVNVLVKLDLERRIVRQKHLKRLLAKAPTETATKVE